MLKRILSVFVLLAIATPVLAQSLDGLSLADLDTGAQEAYRARLYSSAESHWLTALETPEAKASSEERGRVLYNLGNTAFRQERTLEAIAWYAASIKLRPRDEDTWANLEFALSEAEIEDSNLGRRNLLAVMTLAESERLVLLVTLALLATLLGEAFLGGAFFRRLAGVLALGLLVSLAPWVYGLSQQGSDRGMIVKKAGAPLRSEPRVEATLLLKLDPGREYAILDEMPDWVKLEADDCVEGWVKAKSVFRTDR